MEMIELIKSSANFAELIKFIYEEKQKKNSRYSVRAFARKLEVSSSFLQKIINGEKSPSEKFIHNTFKILELDTSYLEAFLKLGDRRNLSNLSMIKSSRTNLKNSTEIIVISLINLAGAPSTKEWVLGLIPDKRQETIEALDRLMETGLIIEKEGKLVVCAEKQFRIPYEEFDGQEGPVLSSIRKDFSVVDPEDRVEYMFVPGNNSDAPYMHKFIASQLSALGGTLTESKKTKDQLFQVACYIRPLIQE
jgi:transcriptional regulator with XRE-family HTH domain